MLVTWILFLITAHKTPPKPSLNGCYKVDDSSHEVYLLFYWIYSEAPREFYMLGQKQVKVQDYKQQH